jgi:hypothetical protein
MGQETTNPAMGVGDLSDLGAAFGSVEPNPETKANTPPRGNDGRFQARAQDTADEDDDEGAPPAGHAPAEPHEDDDEPPANVPPGEDDGEGEGDGEPVDGEQFTLKVNGQEKKLTRAQVLEAASKGLAAHETWQKASATQKQADDLIGLVNQQREQLNGMLGVVQQHINALIKTESGDLDTLAQTDPAAWVRQKHAFDQRQQQLRDAMAAQAYLADQQKQLTAIQKQQFLDLQQEKVLEAIPAWRNPDKAKTGVQRINTLLSDAGFSAQEIADIGDARIVRVLNAAAINADKARKYDELRGKSGAAAQRVANLPPVTEKPGTRQPPQSQRAETRKRNVQAWEKKPGIDTLAPLFEGL